NWACNQIIENKTDDRGQFFHDLLRGYEQHGICLDAEMPYRDEFDGSLAPTAVARQKALQIRGFNLRAHWIQHWSEKPGLTADQLREIRQTLAAGWPVAAGSG